MNSSISLDTLAKGVSARIKEVTGSDAVSVRLMEMGLVEGETIELVGAAPLGDPLEFLVQGYHITLRKAEARRVQVSLL